MDTPITQPIPPPQPKNNSGVFIGILIFILGMVVGIVIDKTTILSNLLIPNFRAMPTPKLLPTPSPAPDPMTNWKTYQIPEFAFKYPSDWQLDTDSKKIFSSNPKIVLWSFGSNDPMYNECMKVNDTKILGNTMIKTFSRVTTGEACSGKDTTSLEKWIVKVGGQGYAPGIQYIYTSTEKEAAEAIFNQILSTFTFTSANCTGKCPLLTPPHPDLCKNGIEVAGKTNQCGCYLGPDCVPFTCPPSGWADCMPSPNSPEKCTDREMNWYKANCPDFKGGAY